MVSADGTVLTDRQVEVLKLREEGYTQREVADKLGTTDANVSAIERAARKNIKKAHRTVELKRTLQAPVRFSVPAGVSFEDLVGEIYSRGNDAGIDIEYQRPELHARLYDRLEDHSTGDRLETPVDIGLTEEGDLKVFAEDQ